ncbi:MAG: hypothetical protein OIN66_08190 [Candidatus Methanoperedens sp.]|nr:hypothetical protein [Candidatus Methanoperedens sp.]
MEETSTQQKPPKIVHKPGYLQIDGCVCEAHKITYAVENMEKVDLPKKIRMLSND